MKPANLSGFFSPPSIAVEDIDLFGSTLPAGVRAKKRIADPTLEFNPELSVSERRKIAARENLEREGERRAAKEANHTPRRSAKRFTTDAAIEWGRKQGWKLVDRERYDFRTKRHHDLDLGSDARMETATGFVLLQGAGKSERKEHRERFDGLGGIDRAMKLGWGFIYLEFERNNPEPLVIEVWA
jgi:hypothetical protein